MPRRRLSTTRSTGHVVAAADKSRDPTEKRVAGRSLVEFDVLGGQALDHHIHDLGDDVANLVVLKLVSEHSHKRYDKKTHVRVDALQNSIKPGQSLL